MSLKLIGWFYDSACSHMKTAMEHKNQAVRLEEYRLAEAAFLNALSCRDCLGSIKKEILEIRMQYRVEFGRTYNM